MICRSNKYYQQIIEQMKRGREASVSVPKDIDLIIYRFAHRDLMKQLNSEYERTIIVCDCVVCNNVCSSYIMVLFFGKKLPYNYRPSVRLDNCGFIYDKWNNSYSKLPKNY